MNIDSQALKLLSGLSNLQAGGNSVAKAFFQSQSDIKPGMDFAAKYNSRAAALFRDKVSPVYVGQCMNISGGSWGAGP